MRDNLKKIDGNKRRLLTATGAGLLTTLGLGQSFAASSTTPIEATSEKETFVNNFCADWSKTDVEALTPYLSDTIEYYMWEKAPPIKGIDAFRKQITTFMASMNAIDWEVLQSASMGDIVINERIDRFSPGEGSQLPTDRFDVVGLFVVREGKIQYWKDFGIRDAD